MVLTGRQNMIGALKRLQTVPQPENLPSEMAGLGIAGARPSEFKALFISHPSPEDRIVDLERGNRRNQHATNP
jgi:heat shock protein HtpX